MIGPLLLEIFLGLSVWIERPFYPINQFIISDMPFYTSLFLTTLLFSDFCDEYEINSMTCLSQSAQIFDGPGYFCEDIFG